MNADIWAEVHAERERAHAKHGDKSMEAASWTSEKRLRILMEEVGEVAREFNEADFDDRTPHPAKLRAELIQVAAMAGAWADIIPSDILQSDTVESLRAEFDVLKAKAAEAVERQRNTPTCPQCGSAGEPGETHKGVCPHEFHHVARVGAADTQPEGAAVGRTVAEAELDDLAEEHHNTVPITEDVLRSQVKAMAASGIVGELVWRVRTHTEDVVTDWTRPTDTSPEACPLDAGERPYWMGVDQYDPCKCLLTKGHEPPCVCSHTAPADAAPESGEGR